MWVFLEQGLGSVSVDTGCGAPTHIFPFPLFSTLLFFPFLFGRSISTSSVSLSPFNHSPFPDVYVRPTIFCPYVHLIQVLGSSGPQCAIHLVHHLAANYVLKRLSSIIIHLDPISSRLLACLDNNRIALVGWQSYDMARIFLHCLTR